MGESEPRGIDVLAFSVDSRTEFTSLAGRLLTYASKALKYLLVLTLIIDSLNAVEALLAFPEASLARVLQILANSYKDTISVLIVYIVISVLAAVVTYEHRRLVARKLESTIALIKRAQGNSISLEQLRSMFKNTDVLRLLAMANAWIVLKGERSVLRLYKDPNTGLDYVTLIPLTGEAVPIPAVQEQVPDEGTNVFDIS